MTSFFLVAAELSEAGDEIHIVKIAAEGGRAVVKDPNGRLRAIRPGDKIPPYGKVTQILENRIVLVNTRNETLFIEMADGVQRIQRVSRVQPAPAREIMSQTVVGSVGGRGAELDVDAGRPKK